MDGDDASAETDTGAGLLLAGSHLDCSGRGFLFTGGGLRLTPGLGIRPLCQVSSLSLLLLSALPLLRVDWGRFADERSAIADDIPLATVLAFFWLSIPPTEYRRTGGGGVGEDDSRSLSLCMSTGRGQFT